MMIDYDACGEPQPGNSGFRCTLPAGHAQAGQLMHEAGNVGHAEVYAAWSADLPRPQVRITEEAMSAFLRGKNESLAGAGTQYIDGLRAFLAALGIEVIE